MKKILFPLFSAFLVYRSYILLQSISSSTPAEFNNTGSVLFAFLLALYITGVFAFIGFAYPSNRLLPSSYYAIKKPKLLNSTYEFLGVEYFRKVLMLAFWGRKKNRKKFFSGTAAGIENLVYQSKQSEFGHFASFLILFPISVYLVCRGFWAMATTLTILNMLGNVYPVILQRKHRWRVERILKR